MFVLSWSLAANSSLDDFQERSLSPLNLKTSPPDLDQPLRSEEDEDEGCNDEHPGQASVVTIVEVQLWHVDKVHSIDSRDESQRNKEGAEHRQDIHQLIRPKAD